MTYSLSSASTSPTRRHYYDSNELPSAKPNKYKLIFEQQERLGSRGYSPNKRIKDQGERVKELQNELDANIKHSYFFTTGTQKNSPHFQSLFREFFANLKSADHIINAASIGLGKKCPKYVDVSRFYEKVTVDEYGIDREITQAPTVELVAELQELFEQKQWMQQDLLELLKKNQKKLQPELKLHDWETAHAHGGNVDANYFVTYLLKKGLLTLKPSFYQNQKDICTKLLEIAWLSKDIDQLKLFITDNNSPIKPVKSPLRKSVQINDFLPPDITYDDNRSFLFNNQHYKTCTTRGDGSCGLHALLGSSINGEYRYQGDVKQLFLAKINEPETAPVWINDLISILRGHIQVQNASSALLFDNEVGLGLLNEYRGIKPRYDERRSTLKTQEATVWQALLTIRSFQDKLFNEANGPGQERYIGKSNEQIVAELRENPLQLLNLINENRNAFLLECSPQEKTSIDNLRSQDSILIDEMTAVEDRFILERIYPYYAEVFLDRDFYLNTEELELAAHLFNKKMQVLQMGASGTIEATSNITNANLDEAPILIYHEGVHFSRCVPCTEQNYEAITLKNTFEQAKKTVKDAVEQDVLASKKFWSSVKEESSKMAVSAMYSAGTQNPIPFGVQVAKSGVNTFGHYLDPKNESIVMQMAQLIANSGVAKFFGGNPRHIAQGLFVDAVNVYAAPKPSTKEESNLRGIGLACVKGVLTLDPVKFCENALGQVIADGSLEFVPEEQESDGVVIRMIRSAVTSPDMHGVLVDSIVKDPPKTKPKEDTGQIVEVDPDSESQFPKQIITEIENAQAAVEPEMHNPKEYQRLVFEAEGITAALEKENASLIDPNYSKFGTPQDTLIQKKAGVETANDKHEEKFAKFEKACRYRKASKEEASWKSSEKNLKNARGEVTTVETYIDQTTNNIAELRKKLEANRLAQAVASSPKHIPTPNSWVHVIGNEKKGKNHHPHYFENGQNQGLGKYDNAEDARYISGLFISVETNKLSLERQCFNAQGQLVEAGISIDDIPQRPTLSMPTIIGNDVNENQRTLNAAGVNHKKEVQQYLSRLESLLGKPITAQGLSKSEISEIRKQVAPNIKDSKQHGFFFNACRAPGEGLRKGLRWLDDHGVSVNVNVNVSTPLYQTKASQSSYSDTQHQIMLEKSQLSQIEQRDRQISSKGQGENVEAEQTQQMFEKNMAYKSPNDLGQNDPNQSALIPSRQMQTAGVPGNGIAVTAKLVRGLFSLFLPDMSDMPGAENPMDHINRIVTDEATGDFIKSMPKAGALPLRGAVSLMLPDMSDMPGAEDPKEHFKRVFDNTLKKYDQLVQIQTPDGLAAKGGIFVGDMFALGGIGKVIRTAEGLSIFGMACEGGFVGAVMSEAHDTNMVAGISFGFFGGAGVGKLLLRGGRANPNTLIDRTLVRPQGFGQQKIIMGQIETYVAERGLPKAFVAEAWGLRNAQSIKPLKSPPIQAGSELAWLSENTSKINALKKTVP